MLKEERHRQILDRLEREGRVVATDLADELVVSGYTIRRDLDELAGDGRLQRVRGGALPRSAVARTYEGRKRQELPGKAATARAAAKLLGSGQVALIDGGSTALQLVQALAPDLRATVVTHSPPVAAALEHHDGIEVVQVGGTLDRRAMVCTGAHTIQTLNGITADICFLGVWSVHADAGLTTGYFEEAEVRRVLVERAGRVVGLASREKLGTVAPFAIAPATALTHIATEPETPEDLLRPFGDLGIDVVR